MSQHNKNTSPTCLSIAEASARLGCSRGTLYKLLGAGSIDARKLGRSTLVIVSSLDAFIAALPRFASTPEDRGNCP